MRSLAVAFAVVLLTPACKKASSSSGKATDDPAVAKADAGVELAKRAPVFLDSLRIRDVDVGQAASYPPLGAMLPAEFADLGSWASIEIKGHKGKSQTLFAPAKTHPGEVAALFTMQGGIAFGFFAPEELAKKGKPKMLIASVTEVRINTSVAEAGSGGGDGGGGGDEGAERPTATADLKIAIETKAGKSTFTGDKLNAVPTITAPIGDMETPGWTLHAVLTAAGVDAKTMKGKIVLHGDEGANLILEPADLDPATAVPFIKLNRQGKLRFRLFRKVGTTWEVTGELRGIALVEIQ